MAFSRKPLFSCSSTKTVNILLKLIGILLVASALIAFVLTMVSGVGILIALGVLLVAALFSFTKEYKYSIAVLLITTLNIIYLQLNILGWLPQAEHAPQEIPAEIREAAIAAGIPVGENAAPQAILTLSEEEKQAIARALEISPDEVANIPVVDADPSTDSKPSFKLLLNVIALPYLFSALIMFVAYWLRRSKNRTRSH